MIFQAILIFSAILIFVYYNLTKNRDYWTKRGVTDTGFKFFWGDDTFIYSGEAIQDWLLKIYKKYPKDPYIGMWSVLGAPVLMIRNDFELIRSIWVRDFDHFTIANAGRKDVKDIWTSNRNEKLMMNNIQSAQGDDWKNIRYKNFITPYFLRPSDIGEHKFL